MLPRKYKNTRGNHPEHEGKDKISYSQYTSYNDPQYKYDYYLQYFSGLDLGGNIFSEFGGFVGTKIEYNAKGEEYETPLTENCLKILKEQIDYPENCVYEDEIVIDLGDGMVCEGFADRVLYTDDNGVEVLDYKTLNIDKKKDFYGSDLYGQTSAYCYYFDNKGYKIKRSHVSGLGRKGNSWNGKYPLRLSGEIVDIDTPYTRERGEKIAADIKKTAQEISEDYKIYLKFFGDKK